MRLIIFLTILVVAVGVSCLPVPMDSERKMRDVDIEFLEDITEAVVEASRVRVGEKVGQFGPNITGGTLIRPGGRDCYPAFWIRDFAMSLESGLITLDEQRHALLLMAAKQQRGDWDAPSGSFVPDGSITDHISFSGVPIFFPGTIDDYQGQGGVWGKLPPFDDNFFFVHMAWCYVKNGGDQDILTKQIDAKRLIDRLDSAFASVPSRADTKLVFCEEENRGVGFGFTDSIIHTGDLLFCSVLKYRAAEQMAELFHLIGDGEKAKYYETTAELIKRNIPKIFKTDTGFLRASTGKSSQPDVWTSAFAVYVGALEPYEEKTVCAALAKAYKDGTLSYRGNIRHVLTTDDYSEQSMWEKTIGSEPNKNRYQNGAYWATPVGWVCYAMAKVDANLAKGLAKEYINELREGDFRQGDNFGSPWECMHPDGGYKQNAVYMTSVTTPLGAFKRLGW